MGSDQFFAKRASVGIADDTAVTELIAFALDSLSSLRHGSGLYCYDRVWGATELRGESFRYSFMVLLGLQRAQAAGYSVAVDLDALFEACLDRRSTFTLGDIGLAMWADSRCGGNRHRDLLAQLQRAAANDSDLDELVGMEIAWLVTGLSLQVGIGADDGGMLARVLRSMKRRVAPSGLFLHDGASKPRSRFPNFATEIYAVLALATAARLDLDGDARALAENTANQLLRLQIGDGGWPWLFDARRGTVVERYEIYTVHQDAMAPMALLELSAVTGDARYRDAAIAGLAWSRGHNELGVDLLDAEHHFAHRSIRRKSPWNRAAQAANVAGSVVAGRPIRVSGSALEVNRTCRPYHLGWMLEAWAGRELEGSDAADG